jgi:hypothetical protein
MEKAMAATCMAHLLRLRPQYGMLETPFGNSSSGF